MRGIFSAGILDEFLVQKHDPFDIYIGVSAGACNLSSHVAGQYQRNYRLYTGAMLRPEFFNFKRFLLGGHYMDLDWLWDLCEREDPLDVPAAVSNTRGKEFFAVCTAVDTGRPVYLQPNRANWNDVLKASSAIPVFYRRHLQIGPRRVVDGGVSDFLPVQFAASKGAKRIVVIRPHPPGHLKKNNLDVLVASIFLLRHPALRATIRAKPSVAADAVRFIDNPPEGIQVDQIAPRQSLRTGRNTRDLQALEEDYQLAREIAREYLADQSDSATSDAASAAPRRPA
jgi:predicted patatin/cPLA2 family phospholipase